MNGLRSSTLSHPVCLQLMEKVAQTHVFVGPRRPITVQERENLA
ncbi:MAG: hypothetical protein ACI87A_003234 [Planctomycetota bacterium]|jgi:hypothetical protein